MKASVCLAAYNGGDYISDQLASIVSQLNDGDELLVADDGSSDNTVQIVRGFHPRARLLSTTRVGGVVPNFERLIAAASGDILVLCDQDDVWLPGRLDLIRNALARADLVVLNGQVVDESLNPRGRTVFELVGCRSGFIRNLAKNSFVGCCMAFRNTLRDKVVPFPAGVPWHDWYIGLVAECLGRIEYINDVTMLYRRHSNSASKTGEKSLNSLFHMTAMRIAVLRATVIALLR